MIEQKRGGRIIGESSVVFPSCVYYLTLFFLQRSLLNCWKERQRNDRCLFRQQICYPIVDPVGRYDASALPLLKIHSFSPFSIACEWGIHGITVNAYAPGTIDTPMCQFPCYVENGTSLTSIFTVREAAGAVITPSGASVIDQVC